MQKYMLRKLQWHLGLRRQLLLAFGLISALLIITSVTMLATMAYVHRVTQQAIDVDGRLNRLSNDVAIYMLQCRTDEKDMYLHLDDPTTRTYDFLLWQGAYNNLDQAITVFQSAATTPEDQQQVAAWRALIKKYQTAIVQTEQAVLAGRITTVQQANDSLKPFEEDIRALTTSALTVAQVKSVAAQQGAAELDQLTTPVRLVVLTVVGVAIIIALAWSLLFSNRLMRPIAALHAATSRLAGGDLAARVTSTRQDELGMLAHNFNHMATMMEQRTGELHDQYAAAQAAQVEAEAGRSEIAAQLATIEEQQTIIHTMSVPILPLNKRTMVIPLVGNLDSTRLDMLQQQALQALEQSSARHLILDITAVPIVDTHVAHGLIQVVRAARLLGAEVILVGIRPEVAQTLVGLGVDLGSMVTQSTLQSGMAYALQRG